MITEIFDRQIAQFNTFGMDVVTASWIDYTEPKDLPEVMSLVGDRPWKCIGEGSNLLFLGDYDGVLLHSNILTMESQHIGNNTVAITLGSGLVLDRVIEWCVSSGLWGIENLSAIPGQVGAAAVQNVGAYGVEISDVIDYVECYDTLERRFVSFSRDECQYGYRTSIFKIGATAGRYIVTSVTIRLSTVPCPHTSYGALAHALGPDAESPTLLQVRDAIIEVRDAKLPQLGVVGSAGSFFKNPVVPRQQFEAIAETHAGNGGGEVPHYDLEYDMVKIPAAWLIEQTGWKGRSHGNAAVWHKQPLILVNANGQATPQEVVELQQAIIGDVERRFGIILAREVEFVPEPRKA